MMMMMMMMMIMRQIAGYCLSLTSPFMGLEDVAKMRLACMTDEALGGFCYCFSDGDMVGHVNVLILGQTERVFHSVFPSTLSVKACLLWQRERATDMRYKLISILTLWYILFGS